jgi:choline dehydrogenase-like flavoprotein
MLNSRSASFPQGLGNAQGLVGKYIMDSVGTSVGGQIPALENLPPHNEDGAGGPHMYIPWWLYKEQLAGKLGFPRGYHVEFNGSRPMPGGHAPLSEDLVRGAYGTKYKEEARRYFGSMVGYTCRGEMVPNEQSFAEIDPEVKDQWGIPVLRWHWKWGEEELRMADHAAKTFAEMIEAMGGKVRARKNGTGRDGIEQGGRVIHEVGGALMGEDPKKSVCDAWNQVHGVKNLILADGSPFASNADKNPTLTIMALAWRAADHLVEESKKGNL